jgi:hypothetical protein
MKFQLNLIREMQADRETAARRRKRVLALLACCYGVLVLSMGYCTMRVLHMQSIVFSEKDGLQRVKTEFQHYKATEMIVSKADVELLDRLQNNRIFWTKKLVVMARCLPENYWITEFSYDRQALGIAGYGYISYKQDQLLTLHTYLNDLRAAPMFNDIFQSINLRETRRSEDEHTRTRVSFAITCLGGK